MTPKYPADKKRNTVDVEREAAAARPRLGFDPEQPLPSLLLFERLATLRVGPGGNIGVDYHVADLLDGVEADTSFVKTRGQLLVTLGASTYRELERNVPRARFSAAHETGHVFQHWAEVVRLSTIPHRTAALLRGNYSQLERWEDVEWQADAFAAALLIPARALWQLERQGVTLTESLLCNRFGVSVVCAKKRLRVYGDKKGLLLR